MALHTMTAPGPRPTFISESIKPVAATADAAAMAGGGPGLPDEFQWREQRLRIRAVLRAWKETGPCKHGSGELYVRKHWFEVLLTSGETARVYFERQPRGKGRKDRWWLYTLQQHTT
jgi:phosphoribosylglycinamide formyltransferase-1